MSRSACAPFWFAWWGVRRAPEHVFYYEGRAYESERELAQALLGKGDEHPDRLPLLAGYYAENGKLTQFARERIDDLMRAERERAKVEKAEGT